MSFRALLITVSVVANLGLAVAVTNRSVHWTTLFSSSDAASSGGTVSSAAKPAAPPEPRISPEIWNDLSGGDLAGTLARLRAEGFPPRLQRAILAALVREQFADRHRALAAMISAHPWWRGNLYGSESGAKILTARQQLSRDEKDALDQLLGADSDLTDYTRAQRIHQFGNLSPEKLSELNRISADYNELMSEIRNAAQGIILPEDREKLAYLEKEKRADIEKLLSPDELLDYDLRNSPSASSLRNRLSAFNPTEDEFRAIFKLQQTLDAQYAGGSFDLMTADQRRAYFQAQSAMAKQVEPLLSPERYAEFQQKTDPAYIQANAIVTRLQLPATATADVVAVQKDIMKRAGTIQGDRSLTPDNRAAQMKALGDEAVLRLTQTLGDTGVAAYKQSGGGSWINYLQRTPTPPATKR